MKKTLVPEGIDAVRREFKNYWFDEHYCHQLLAALGAYHKEWDEVNSCYKNKPVHDWSCHGADMVRTGAVATKMPQANERKTLQRVADFSFDPFTHGTEQTLIPAGTLSFSRNY